MRNSALLRIAEVFVTANKQNGAYEKYMVPDIYDETRRLMYHQAQRTVTENHMYQFYAAPDRESFVQCEEEYHTVRDHCADPCDSGD